MAKHASPAKKLRSYKRLINYLIQKKTSPKLAIQYLPQINIPTEVKILSSSLQTTCPISPNPKELTITKPVLTDIPPCSQPVHQSENQENLLVKFERLQSEINEAEKGFQDMLNLKNEHIQMLTEHLQNLPAQITRQFQHLQQP